MDSGYNVVCIYHNGNEYWCYVHRLVAEAFIPIPEKYINMGLTIKDLEVNHKDGSFSGKSNNSVTNLEWVSSTDNKYHAYKTRLKKSCEDFPVAKYTDEQIHKVCKMLQDNKLGNRDIWKATGVSVNTISMILSGKQWKDISKYYNFENHSKRHILYTNEQKKRAKTLLSTTDISFKDIGDIIGMTRNSVWFINKKFGIRE